MSEKIMGMKPAYFFDIKDGMHENPERGCQILKFYYWEDVWGRNSTLEFMMHKAGFAF